MFRNFAIVGILALATASPTRNLDGKIVGGYDINIEEVPYQVSLRSYESHNCGGSIISDRHILTAGHCVGGSPHPYSVRVGSTQRQSGGSIHQAVKVISHNFTITAEGVPINDLAILEVSPPFEFNEKCAPIPLYDLKEKIKPETIALISGWGRTSTGGLPSHLQAVKVPIISKEDCNEAYDFLASIPEGEICAAYPSGGKDSCQGDSGGPLSVDGRLAGIVSWGIGCGVKGNPGVYTSVAYYADWIQEKISA
ncbi:trypsin-2-like [Belonocnema kinseyi]|uniref:trypsin-2-like n=1 Tax=Belonocnema kinseyi TaxID=2817044 RepID=UPI00143D4031|nr:trypsin-2-like [Belonocnema kinseyi]